MLFRAMDFGSRSRLSFNLGHNSVGIARVDRLGRTVDDQVEFFENDGADEGLFAVGFERGREDAFPAAKTEPDVRHTRAGRTAVVGIADADLSGRLQSEFVRGPLRQDQTCRAGVDDAMHGEMFDRVGNRIAGSAVTTSRLLATTKSTATRPIVSGR